MSKRPFMTALLVAAATMIALTGASTAREIKLAHLAPTDDPRHLTLTEFAKAVEDRTGGALKVKIFPNSSLGSEREVIEQHKAGLTELGLGGDLMANFYKKMVGHQSAVHVARPGASAEIPGKRHRQEVDRGNRRAGQRPDPRPVRP